MKDLASSFYTVVYGSLDVMFQSFLFYFFFLGRGIRIKTSARINSKILPNSLLGFIFLFIDYHKYLSACQDV